MKRREFIKLSSLSILPLVISCNPDSRNAYDIEISSDMPVGHLVFSKQDFPVSKSLSYEILIVGGGISGLAAACNIINENFILCELSMEPGGTSGSISIDGNRYAQGAHYDLAYPDYFGSETLNFLNDLRIIEFNSFSGLWEFRDKQYLINPNIETQCYSGGSYRNDVIPDEPARETFQAILDPFKKVMKMPTRIIDKEFHCLNEINFSNFLKGKINGSHEFQKSIDYNMVDDYGGTSSEISALAGIHYYQCRPYFYQPVELFSPPQGNYYFIKKMTDMLPPERIKSQHLVRKINKSGDGFDVEVLDMRLSEIVNLKVKKIIYAGSKHALKYVMPDDHHLFNDVKYAPWLVINFVVKNLSTEHSNWQNEFIEDNPNYLGFVDSGAQYHFNGKFRVLTAYYCFKPSERLILANIENNKNRVVDQTIRYINEYFKLNIENRIEKVYIKVMGHAMPVPGINYLFNDKNIHRSNKDMVYAGVDNSRLPLLFEALDSGIYAAHLIKE